PPPDLTFHIRQAVEIGGARRIGHGVSLAFERDAQGLLADMRARPVVVEISLTNNDVILGVRGKDHPFPVYLAAGVPVVLSTDDAGVSRIDLTNKYFRAARDYGLGYAQLKAIARNSLSYSSLADNQKRDQLERFEHRRIRARRGKSAIAVQQGRCADQGRSHRASLTPGQSAGSSLRGVSFCRCGMVTSR